MPDYTSITSNSIPPIFVSNVVELSDGSLVYCTIDNGGAGANYMGVFRSTDKGQTYSRFSKMKAGNANAMFSIMLSARGMRVAITGAAQFGSYYTFLTGIDFSTAAPATIEALDTAAPTGYWTWRNLGGDFSLGRPTALHFGSDGNVYVCWYTFHNFSSNDDEWYSYFASYPFGSAGTVFQYQTNGGAGVYSGEIIGYTITEYQGRVLLFYNGGSFAWTVPLGSGSVSIFNTSIAGTPMAALIHPTDGYMYMVAPSAFNISPSNSWSLRRTNNVGASPITWTVVASGTLPAPSTSGNTYIRGAQMGADGNIWIFYAIANGTADAGIYVLCMNTAGTILINGTRLVAPNTQLTGVSGTYTIYNNHTNVVQKSVNVVGVFGGLNNMYTWTRVFNQPPNAPTGLNNGKGTWGWFNASPNPTYSWNHSDPDGGPQGYWHLQRSSDNWATVDYDTGVVAGTANSHLIGWSNQGAQYVRVQTADPNGEWGPFAYDGYNYDVTNPTANSSAATRYLNVAAGGTFRVQVTGAGDALSGVAEVRFPTWTASGGQDDIIWYPGVNAGSGTWYYDVPIANHGNTEGQYLTDPYVYDYGGNSLSTGTIVTWVDRTVPTAPTQTNGTLFATTNSVSWSSYADGANSSGRKTTTLHLQSWNGSTWNNVAGFPIADVGAVSSYSFTGLTPGTQYRWGVIQTDNANNANVLTYTTFTTNAYAVSTIVNMVAATGSLLNQKPAIRFTVTDANDATLTNFQIQVSIVNTFASTVLDTTSSAVAAGWSATSAASGSTIKYTPQANIATGFWYVRTRAFDGKDWGTWSTSSFTIAAVSWPTTVSAADTAVSKRTIDSLRTAVNAARQARGLAVIVWTDPTITDWTGTGTNVRAVHVTEIRQAITDIYTALGNTVPTWTDTTIVASSTQRKGTHWLEMRTALQAA